MKNQKALDAITDRVLEYRPKKETKTGTEQYAFPFYSPPEAGGNGTAFKDPAFMENRDTRIHRWVPWIAGFSGSFVDSVLESFLGRRRSATVLDPFAGVGTTIIQAAMRGWDVIGYEINPYAALVTKTKLNALRMETNTLDEAIAALRIDAHGWQNGRAPTGIAPNSFRSRIPFYSPNVEKQVLHALEFTNNIKDSQVRDLFRIAFGSVMISFSNYTYEPSLGTRPGAGKRLIEDADVAGTLLGKLQQIRDDIGWLRTEANSTKLGLGKVYNGDFFSEGRKLESGSIHLMVTSPPYLNNYHYVRNTRPQLYWLGLISSPAEQKPLEEGNFGTFWQLARDKDHVTLGFEHRELERIIAKIRSLNGDKGNYGGNGWANYAASYFNDCNRFLVLLKRVLTRGGTGMIVVGNSILQGVNVPVQDIFADIAMMRGLSVKGIYGLRNKRVGNSITSSSVRTAGSTITLNESAVVVQKR